MHHDIQIDLDNIASFLINEKSQDSLSINVLNQINIDDEITIIVEKNGSILEEVKNCISSNLPVPILFDDTQDSNSINIEKNLGKVDITGNLISDISGPINFTIHDSVGVASDRKHESKFQKY